MMQPHGGTTGGPPFPLRKGTEVMIAFLGGDPDRPFIAGVVPTRTGRASSVEPQPQPEHHPDRERQPARARGRAGQGVYLPPHAEQPHRHLRGRRAATTGRSTRATATSRPARSCPPRTPTRPSPAAASSTSRSAISETTSGDGGSWIGGDSWENVSGNKFSMVVCNLWAGIGGTYTLQVTAAAEETYYATRTTTIKTGRVDTVEAGGMKQTITDGMTLTITSGGMKHDVHGKFEQTIEPRGLVDGDRAVDAQGHGRELRRLQELEDGGRHHLEGHFGGDVDLKSDTNFLIKAPNAKITATNLKWEVLGLTFDLTPNKHELYSTRARPASSRRTTPRSPSRPTCSSSRTSLIKLDFAAFDKKAVGAKMDQFGTYLKHQASPGPRGGHRVEQRLHEDPSADASRQTLKVPALTRVVEVARRLRFHVGAMMAFPLDARARSSTRCRSGRPRRRRSGASRSTTASRRRRGELLVAGRCIRPEGRRVGASFVRARLGSVDKRLAVLGDRYWSGHGFTEPEPFSEMPIDWARALGGPKDAANPYGKGIEEIERGGQRVRPLPNVEHYGALIRSPGDRPGPASFLAMDVTFAQRRARAGTYGADYAEKWAPGLPPDVDPAFFNVAPGDQWIAEPLRGDEAFLVENMHPTRPRIEARSSASPRACSSPAATRAGRRSRSCPSAATRCGSSSANLGVAIFHGSMLVADDDAGEIVDLVVACEEIGRPLADRALPRGARPADRQGPGLDRVPQRQRSHAAARVGRRRERRRHRDGAVAQEREPRHAEPAARRGAGARAPPRGAARGRHRPGALRPGRAAAGGGSASAGRRSRRAGDIPRRGVAEDGRGEGAGRAPEEGGRGAHEGAGRRDGRVRGGAPARPDRGGAAGRPAALRPRRSSSSTRSWPRRRASAACRTSSWRRCSRIQASPSSCSASSRRRARATAARRTCDPRPCR